jgi:hypothetical protein
MIEQITCDWCERKLDPYKMELVRLTVDGTRYELDCCKSCAKQVADVLDDLTRVARKLEDVTPDMIHMPAVDESYCRLCSTPFKNANGLKVHNARKHR